MADCHFELARRGNAVIASDIVPRNVDIMRQKQMQMQKPLLDNIFVGDICEMNPYEDHSFDVVLCMGHFTIWMKRPGTWLWSNVCGY